MKHHSTLPAAYVETPKAKLLVAKIHKPIEAESFLVLRKVDDQYRFEVIQQSSNETDPAALASFLPPEVIDASELFHAACIALETTKATRKPRKRKNAAASRTGARK